MRKILVALLFISLVSFAISETNKVNGSQKPSLPLDRPSAEEIFIKMDVDQDGSISIEEFKKAHQKRMQHEKESRTNSKIKEQKQHNNN